MKIGLFDIDSKYHNLALMKLSAYHKSKGHEVEFYQPILRSIYDKIYVSKIFTKRNINEGYIPEECTIGGSGFDLISRLPDEIEHTKPDYELYDLNYSLGFTTRGCQRNCAFCIVKKKKVISKSMQR